MNKHLVSVRHLFSTALIGLLFSAHTFAETNTIKLSPIVITTPESVQPLWSSTGNYSATSREQIDNTKHTHINEILSGTPGVWISKGSGQEHLTAIRSASITGPGACGAFLYLQDNIPVRPAGFCNINNLFEINSEQADTIEVIRGPSSSVFGGNALNGLINITTREPSKEDETQLSLEAGPYDFYRVKLSNSLREKSSAVRLDFNSASSNGYRDNTGYGQQKLTLRVDSNRQEWINSSVISGSLLNQETGAYVEGENAYSDPSLKRSNPSPEAYRDAWSSRIHTRFTKKSKHSELTLTPYWRRSQMNFLMHFLPGTPAESNEQTSAGLQANFSWNVSKHTFFSGLRMEGAEIELQQNQVSPEVFGKLPQGKQYDFDVDTRYFSTYIGADWLIGDKIHLLNSVRFESLYYDYENNMLSGNTREDGSQCNSVDGCRYTRPASSNDTFSDGAVRLGFSYDFNDRSQFFASIGSGFRAPQATDLYRLQAGQENADIDSEKISSFELGLNRYGHRYHSQITAYSQKKKNVIYRNSDRYVFNDGATKSEGIELALNIELNIDQQLSFAGSYARHQYENTWGYEVATGDDMDTAPRKLAQISWLYQPSFLLNGKTSWVLDASHTSRYFMEPTNTVFYPGHTLFNARVSYALSSVIELSSRMINISNKVYAERADYAFGSERYFPGAPRSLFFAFEWQF